MSGDARLPQGVDARADGGLFLGLSRLYHGVDNRTGTGWRVAQARCWSGVMGYGNDSCILGP